MPMEGHKNVTKLHLNWSLEINMQIIHSELISQKTEVQDNLRCLIKVCFLLTYLCWKDSATSALWTSPFPIEGVSGWFWILHVPCFIEVLEFTANIVDPDQMWHLGLHCLPMPLLWDARHKWVKVLDKDHFYWDWQTEFLLIFSNYRYINLIPCPAE